MAVGFAASPVTPGDSRSLRPAVAAALSWRRFYPDVVVAVLGCQMVEEDAGDIDHETGEGEAPAATVAVAQGDGEGAMYNPVLVS